MKKITLFANDRLLLGKGMFFNRDGLDYEAIRLLNAIQRRASSSFQMVYLEFYDLERDKSAANVRANLLMSHGVCLADLKVVPVQQKMERWLHGFDLFDFIWGITFPGELSALVDSVRRAGSLNNVDLELFRHKLRHCEMTKKLVLFALEDYYSNSPEFSFYAYLNQRG